MSLVEDPKAVENHPIMQRYISYYKKLKEIKLFNFNTIYNIVGSIIIAPFYTISIARQLSVTPHKEIYGDYVNPKNSKELMKISNELTLRDSRNFELVKSSGVLEGQKPYRAPIYDNYRETIRGLYRQGILAFYKGNLTRLATTATSQRLSISMQWALKERYEFFKRANFIRDLICMSMCDMITHLGFVMENRYILQNRLPQFHFYKNYIKFFYRSYNEITRGSLGHIPKNFLFLLGYNIHYFSPNMATYIFSIILGGILSYPYMTAFRRIVCESTSIPGLLPIRYLNVFHAVSLIRREEGIFRGLYKGFFFYLIGLFIWASLVPGNAYLHYQKRKIQEDENIFGDDPVFEEIKRRKLQSLRE